MPIITILATLLLNSSQPLLSSEPHKSSINLSQYLGCFFENKTKSLFENTLDSEREMALLKSNWHPHVSLKVDNENDFLLNKQRESFTIGRIEINQLLLDLEEKSKIQTELTKYDSEKKLDYLHLFQKTADVIPAYFELNRQQDSFKILKEKKNRYENLIKVLREMAKIKSIDGLDINLIQLEIMHIDTQISTLEINIAQSQRYLATAAQLKNYIDFTPNLSAITFANKNLTFDDFIQVQSQTSLIKTLWEEKNFYDIGLLPKITLKGFYNKEIIGSSAADFDRENFGAMINFSMPLYNGGQQNIYKTSTIKKEILERFKLKELREKNKDQLELYESEILILENRIRIHEDKLGLIEKIKQSSWIKLQIGKMSLIDYHQVDQNMQESYQKLIDLKTRLASLESLYALYHVFSGSNNQIKENIASFKCNLP